MSITAGDDKYEECIVTFLDVLGFRSLLKNHSPAEVKQFIEILRSSAASDAPIEPSTRMKYYRLQSEVVTENISDAVVRIRTKDTQYRGGSLSWEVLDLIHAQIDCISSGILVRGALTVGDIFIGMDGDGPIFGPALVRAYEMEQSEAVYPRIVIDDRVFEKLKADRFMRREGHSLKDEMDFLKRLIATDEAGLRFIDYLRASEGECDSQGHYLEFLQRHKSIIEKGLSENLDQKAHRKYMWLKTYHNKHISPIIAKYKANSEACSSFFEEYDLDAVSYFEELIV